MTAAIVLTGEKKFCGNELIGGAADHQHGHRFAERATEREQDRRDDAGAHARQHDPRHRTCQLVLPSAMLASKSEFDCARITSRVVATMIGMTISERMKTAAAGRFRCPPIRRRTE